MPASTPESRACFTLAEIVDVAGGKLAAGHREAVVRGVTVDSHAVVAGTLFVALGHPSEATELAVAADRGAGAVVARRGTVVPAGVSVVEVDDPAETLAALGRAHRRRWGGTVVAVAGSSGKTTTKSVVAAALAASGTPTVYAVAGQLGDPVGVSLALLGLDAARRVAVVEIGATAHAMGRLAALVEPNVGVLTLAENTEARGGSSHAEAEGSAFFGVLPRSGTAIANVDDEQAVRQLLHATSRKKIAYGTRGAADYRVLRRETVGIGRSTVTIERPRGRGRETLELEVPLLGLPGALSVAAAVAVADRIAGRSVPAERLTAALSASDLGEPERLWPVELSDHTVVLDDGYNANPASVRAAVATAREFADDRGARLVLVLGEMRELGSQAAPQHERIGRDIGASGAAVLVAVGGEAARFVEPARELGVEAAFADDAERAAGEVLRRVRPGDVVLVKASRGAPVRRVVEELIRAKGRAA